MAVLRLATRRKFDALAIEIFVLNQKTPTV
jgi:hypothetical protein